MAATSLTKTKAVYNKYQSTFCNHFMFDPSVNEVFVQYGTKSNDELLCEKMSSAAYIKSVTSNNDVTSEYKHMKQYYDLIKKNVAMLHKRTQELNILVENSNDGKIFYGDTDKLKKSESGTYDKLYVKYDLDKYREDYKDRESDNLPLNDVLPKHILINLRYSISLLQVDTTTLVDTLDHNQQMIKKIVTDDNRQSIFKQTCNKLVRTFHATKSFCSKYQNILNQHKDSGDRFNKYSNDDIVFINDLLVLYDTFTDFFLKHLEFTVSLTDDEYTKYCGMSTIVHVCVMIDIIYSQASSMKLC